MTVTRSGQVSWDGLLIDVAPGESGLWIPQDADRSGWHPRRKRAVYETEAGIALGKPLWEPMFPAIDGLAVDSAEALAVLLAAMDQETVTASASLEWWSFERDQVLTAEALPYRCDPVENDDSERQPTRFVNVAWAILRPGEITGDGS